MSMPAGPGYAVTGYKRDRSRARGAGLPGGQISAVVDAELGILLRYSKSGPGIRTESAEFSELEVQDPESADSALFSCPDGVRVTEEGPPGTPPADLAASDENSGTGEPVSDDLIGQLYEAGLRRRRFTAVLHERADGDAIGAVMRAEGSGGHKAIRQLAEFAAGYTENVDLTARLQMDIPGRYRIEVLTGAGRAPASTVCDGEHVWQVFADRIFQRPAAPLPAGFAPLLDQAWLLDGYRLSPGGTALVAGRPGLRFTAEPASGKGLGRGVMSRASFPYDEVEVVIDEDSGVALRLSWSCRGQLLLTAELTDVSGEVEQDAFAFEPPPGIPVHTNPLAAITAKDMAGMAVKAVKLAADIGKRMRQSRP
jgi:hypothetical protein